MKATRFAGLFFRSVPGIAGLAAAFVAGAVSLAAGFGIAGALALSVSTLALFFAGSIGTRRGVTALVGRRDGDLSSNVARRLETARADRAAMAAMRLVNPELARARDRLVLEAGKFLEASAARLNDRKETVLPLYDPAGLDTISTARALLDAAVRELDESSSERRFGGPDAHPVEDAIPRTVSLLDSGSDTLAGSRDRITGRMDASTMLAIGEEIR